MFPHSYYYEKSYLGTAAYVVIAALSCSDGSVHAAVSYINLFMPTECIVLVKY